MDLTLYATHYRCFLFDNATYTLKKKQHSLLLMSISFICIYAKLPQIIWKPLEFYN